MGMATPTLVVPGVGAMLLIVTAGPADLVGVLDADGDADGLADVLGVPDAAEEGVAVADEPEPEVAVPDPEAEQAAPVARTRTRAPAYDARRRQMSAVAAMDLLRGGRGASCLLNPAEPADRASDRSSRQKYRIHPL